jgi:hypothetical protein
VRGGASDVSASGGVRFLCYCVDCGAFARFLGRPDVLDAAGGTDIFHLPPARVHLTAGTDALAGVAFSSKVIRWYAACCRTPVANTAASASFPVVALIHSFMDHDADGRSREQALGPARCRIYERSAVAPLAPNAPPPMSAGVVARRASLLLAWWLRGLARPTPFFDPRSGAPRVAPQVIGGAELEALRSPPNDLPNKSP